MMDFVVSGGFSKLGVKVSVVFMFGIVVGKIIGAGVEWFCLKLVIIVSIFERLICLLLLVFVCV